MKVKTPHDTSQAYRPPTFIAVIKPAVIIGAAVFLACLLGIVSRPSGFLASVWLANAVMLGLIMRLPSGARWPSWIAGAAAYLAADMLTGAPFIKAALLNSANLVSVFGGYVMLSRLPSGLIRLQQPLSMLYIVGASLLGGLCAGVVGAFANPFLFGGTAISGFTYWMIGETVNYLAILPIFLSAPPLRTLYQMAQRNNWSLRRNDLWPALALALSCAAALIVGGPGAIAFPVLALLWAGLVYPVFPTSIVTFISSVFVLIFISTGRFLDGSGTLSESDTLSIRIGVAITAIAPITLAVVIQNRNELLARLRYMSTHDPLTSVNNRRAFREEAELRMAHSNRSHAVLMLDLDHFKNINDTYGHAAGDEVLRETARRVRACLRPDDVLGRMGGEEFAVFLSNCQRQEALEIAERIRSVLAATPITTVPEQLIKVTTSIGVTLVPPNRNPGLDGLLAEADRALYASKQGGRNRVEAAV